MQEHHLIGVAPGSFSKTPNSVLFVVCLGPWQTYNAAAVAQQFEKATTIPQSASGEKVTASSIGTYLRVLKKFETRGAVKYLDLVGDTVGRQSALDHIAVLEALQKTLSKDADLLLAVLHVWKIR